MKATIIDGLVSAVVLAVCLGACGSNGSSPSQVDSICCSGGSEKCSNASEPWCCQSDEDCSADQPTGGPACHDGVCSPAN